MRAKAQEIIQRLQTEPAFRQEVERDPASVLIAAGLPEYGLVDFLRETGIQAEVVGYMGCEQTGVFSGLCEVSITPQRGLPI